MVHIYGHHSNLSVALKRTQSQNQFRALYDGDVVQLSDILPILQTIIMMQIDLSQILLYHTERS